MHKRADEIVAIARSYVDCPYRHQGRCSQTGIDCAGVPICIAWDLSIGRFDTCDYARRPDAKTFRKHMLAAGCTHVPVYEHGDILRMAAPKHPVHVGIYEVDENGCAWLIHAWAPARKVVREPFTTEKRRMVLEAMRFPE